MATIYFMCKWKNTEVLGGRKFLGRSRQVPEGDKGAKNNNSKTKVK